VQSIVSAHHGEISAAPVPGGGLSVEVRFAELQGNETQ
jgi:signal transduction histidine kinase